MKDLLEKFLLNFFIYLFIYLSALLLMVYKI